MIAKVYLWEHDMIMTFDEHGEQVVGWQGRLSKELIDKLELDSDVKTSWVIGNWQLSDFVNHSREDWFETARGRLT